jgi:hypothetical protein
VIVVDASAVLEILLNNSAAPRVGEYFFALAEALHAPTAPLSPPRQKYRAAAGEYLPAFLILAFDLAQDPRIRWIGGFFDNLAAEAHRISFESRIGVPDADFSEPAAGTDPIRERANQQGLAIGAARDESSQAVVLADVIAVVVEMLGVFLQPCPAYRVDDGQRTIVAAGN